MHQVGKSATVITCIVHKWVLKVVQGFHCNKNQCVLIQSVFKKISLNEKFDFSNKKA